MPQASACSRLKADSSDPKCAKRQAGASFRPVCPSVAGASSMAGTSPPRKLSARSLSLRCHRRRLLLLLTPYDIRKALCDNYVPVVAHAVLIPSYIAWTGWRAVGKTVDEAVNLCRHVKKLEEIGCFGAGLEVVPARIGEWLS